MMMMVASLEKKSKILFFIRGNARSFLTILAVFEFWTSRTKKLVLFRELANHIFKACFISFIPFGRLWILLLFLVFLRGRWRSGTCSMASKFAIGLCSGWNFSKSMAVQIFHVVVHILFHSGYMFTLFIGSDSQNLEAGLWGFGWGQNILLESEPRGMRIIAPSKKKKKKIVIKAELLL